MLYKRSILLFFDYLFYLDVKTIACYYFGKVFKMKKNNLSMIKHIHDEIEKRINSSLRSQQLTMAQMHLILELSDAPGQQLSLKELEQLLHVAQSTTAGVAARLEQKGFVESFIDQNDRRVKLVRITDQGRTCCFDSEKQIEHIETQLLDCLTEAEKAIFYELLQKICRQL